MNQKIYFQLIGLGVALTGIISVFSATGVLLKLDDNGMVLSQILAFFIAAAFLTYYMKKRNSSLENFGFLAKKIARPIYCYIAIIISIQPLIFGIDFSIHYNPFNRYSNAIGWLYRRGAIQRYLLLFFEK